MWCFMLLASKVGFKRNKRCLVRCMCLKNMHYKSRCSPPGAYNVTTFRDCCSFIYNNINHIIQTYTVSYVLFSYVYSAAWMIVCRRREVVPIDRSKTKHSFGQPTSKTRSEGELCVLLTAQEITEKIKNQSPRPDGDQTVQRCPASRDLISLAPQKERDLNCIDFS